MNILSPIHTEVTFGPFRLRIGERQLERDGRPIQVGSRALDILIILVQSAGEIVDKRALLAGVWPGVVVEESSVRAHVAGLRKVLGDGLGGVRYITNVPGRGYCFVAPIKRNEDCEQISILSAESRPAPTATVGLPPPLERIIGRDATIAALGERLNSRRFLSLVGPGGIGKTTVAISLANNIAHRFDGKTAFVDLGAVDEGAVVLATIASGLGLRAEGTDFASSILGVLREHRTLLILDGCEHVIDSVAGICERIFFEAPLTVIVTTSREPLRVEGEFIFRLPPLTLPPENEDLCDTDATRYAAVQMFLERARSAGLESVQEIEIPIIAHLCRQLDGLPLALELAAARASSYGIAGLAKLLDQRFGLYWQGRRTAHPRHQTMAAMLDWSHNLLSEYERRVSHRLAVFKGLFSFADAIAVVLAPGEHAGDLIDALDALVAKSLISCSSEVSEMRYRLLDTTRAYAACRLDDSDELVEMQRRHALWVSSQLESQVSPDLIAFHGNGNGAHVRQLGDIRAALEWAFSDNGDSTIAVRLSAVASHVFLSMSLLAECGKWAENGLERGKRDGIEFRLEMTLQAALAVSMMFTSGDHVLIKHAIVRSLELADNANDVHHQVWLLAGLHLLEVREGDVAAVYDVAQRAEAVASLSGDAKTKRLSEWMLGMSHHLAGRQDYALRHCNPQSDVQSPSSSLLLFGLDQRIRALIVQTRALWLAGFADQAVNVAHVAVEEGARSGRPVSHCLALIYSTTVFLWIGDLETAGKTIDILLDQCARHGLSHYRRVAACMQGELWVRRGDIHDGVARLAEQLEHLRSEHHEVLVWGFAVALAEGYAAGGRLDEASRLINETLVAAGTLRFDLPELLRIKAELIIRSNSQAIEEARALLWQAVDIAVEQSARAWLLRCAISLARFSVTHGDAPRARQLLATTVSSMQEGHSTADFQRATDLLSKLQG